MSDINKFRREIDIIDEKILELLEKRFNVVSEIADIKIKINMPIESVEREMEIFKKIEAKAFKKYANYEKRIYSLIIACSKELQLYIKKHQC